MKNTYIEKQLTLPVIYDSNEQLLTMREALAKYTINAFREKIWQLSDHDKRRLTIARLNRSDKPPEQSLFEIKIMSYLGSTIVNQEIDTIKNLFVQITKDSELAKVNTFHNMIGINDQTDQEVILTALQLLKTIYNSPPFNEMFMGTEYDEMGVDTTNGSIARLIPIFQNQRKKKK